METSKKSRVPLKLKKDKMFFAKYTSSKMPCITYGYVCLFLIVLSIIMGIILKTLPENSKIPLYTGVVFLISWLFLHIWWISGAFRKCDDYMGKWDDRMRERAVAHSKI